MAIKTNSGKLDGEVFYASEETVANAGVKDWNLVADKAREDLQAFWAAEAEELEWFKKWDGPG
jgi:acetyl-CoA synthetase